MISLLEINSIVTVLMITVYEPINHISDMCISFVEFAVKGTYKTICYFGLGASFFPQSNCLILVAKY